MSQGVLSISAYEVRETVQMTIVQAPRSQADIARALSVSPQAVSQYACGLLLPSLPRGMALSRLASSWDDDRLARACCAEEKAPQPLSPPEAWRPNGTVLDELRYAIDALTRAINAREQHRPCVENHFVQAARMYLNAWQMEPYD